MNVAFFPRIIPISHDLIDLINSCCPEGSGYRAPDAKQTLEDGEPIVIHDNAEGLGVEERIRAANRAYEQRQAAKTAAAKRTKQDHNPGVSAKTIKMTLEVIADNAPLPRSEIQIRMRRRCLTSHKQVNAALRELLRRKLIAWKEVSVGRGNAKMTVYELADEPARRALAKARA